METILHGVVFSVNKWYCWAIFWTIPLSTYPPRIISSVYPRKISVSEKEIFQQVTEERLAAVVRNFRHWLQRVMSAVDAHIANVFM
jgi:hypothetical protein